MLTVTITNRLAAACSLQGYPALRLARPDGSVAPARIAPRRGRCSPGCPRRRCGCVLRDKRRSSWSTGTSTGERVGPGPRSARCGSGCSTCPAGSRSRAVRSLRSALGVPVRPAPAGSSDRDDSDHPEQAPRRTAALIGMLASLILLAGANAPVPAFAETSGFWFGADSGAPGPANSNPPYNEPSCGTGPATAATSARSAARTGHSSNPSGYGPGNTFAWNRALRVPDTTTSATAWASARGLLVHVRPGQYRRHRPGAPRTGAGSRPSGRWPTGRGGMARERTGCRCASCGWTSRYLAATAGAARRGQPGGLQRVLGLRDARPRGHQARRVLHQLQWGVIMSGHTGLRTPRSGPRRSRGSSPSPCPTTFSDSRQFADSSAGNGRRATHRDMAVVAGQRRLRPDRHEQGAAADHALTARRRHAGAVGPAAGPRTASARKGSPAGAWPAARPRPRGDRGP